MYAAVQFLLERVIEWGHFCGSNTTIGGLALVKATDLILFAESWISSVWLPSSVGLICTNITSSVLDNSSLRATGTNETREDGGVMAAVISGAGFLVGIGRVIRALNSSMTQISLGMVTTLFVASNSSHS